MAASKRNVTLSITGAMPINAYKGLIQRIDEYEERIASGETIAAIVDGVDPALRIVVTGLVFSEVFVFDIDALDPDTATYAVSLVSIGLS